MTEPELKHAVETRFVQDVANGLIALMDERDALRTENARLREALQWFLDNDETNEGDVPMPEYGDRTWNEINEYWIDGLKRARAALEVKP
jgi:regulator of replication initiation timing